MAALPPAARDELRPAMRAVLYSTITAGNPKRAGSRAAQFRRFRRWCESYGTDPFLTGLDDPLPFIMAYAFQYRTGAVAPRGAPVLARTAKDAIRLVCQTIETGMDGRDPRYNSRKMDPRLTRLWKDWGKWDPPPKRVKPIPLGILLEADRLARESGSPALLETARMMWVAYFFLCRPGEYCDTGIADSNHFFRLGDVCLRRASEVINLASASRRPSARRLPLP